MVACYDSPGQSDGNEASHVLVWNDIEPEPQWSFLGPLWQLEVSPGFEVGDPLAQLLALFGQRA